MPFQRGGRRGVVLEREIRIKKFIGLYDADPCSGVRERTLEFIAVFGGFQYVRVADIVDIH